MSTQRTPLRPSEIVPSPVRGDWPSEGSWKWACLIADTLRRSTRETASVVNAATNPGVMGIGVELRQITSGPMRDVTGRILDAGVLNIAAPNAVILALAAGRVFQDANYNVHLTGGYVRNIATPGLVGIGVPAVNVAAHAFITGMTVGGFTGNVRWSAVDVATNSDAAFYAGAVATEWDSYAAMAAAYGFAAPYNALATAVGLNAIYYTVVDY